jgi:hypothetical protein
MRVPSKMTRLERGIACIAVLACLALGGCNQDPTFDASSPNAYLKTLETISAKLGADDRRRLDIALLTLAVGNTVQSNGLLAADIEALDDLVELKRVANPLLYLDRVRPGISGRSGSGVVRYVAANLDDEITRSEARSAAAYKLLSAVVVDHPRFYWDNQRNVPTVEFSVFNGGKTTIARLYVAGVLTTAARPGKWVSRGLSYQFQPALAPGVQMQVTIRPQLVSTYTAKQLERVYDANISMRVTNIEDGAGQKLVPVDTDILEGMRNKRDFLRGT